MIRSISSLIFTFYCLCASAQIISFTAEEIHFRISGDTFYVSGKYTFRNYNSKIARQLVNYPVFTSPVQPAYDSIWAQDADSKKFLAITKYKGNIIVPIEVNAKSEKSIIISYTQKILDSTAVYILTSTSSWNAPLKKACYIIETDSSVHDLFISLAPSKIVKKKNSKIYYIKKKNFMPSTDLFICFKKLKNSCDYGRYYEK